MKKHHAVLAVVLILYGPSFAATANPNANAGIRCGLATAQSMIGAPVLPGVRYRTSTGATVIPPADWRLARCQDYKFEFAKVNQSPYQVDFAALSDAQLDPWKDESTFVAEVKASLVTGDTIGKQKLQIKSLKLLEIDGRPCVDIYREGIMFLRTSLDATTDGAVKTIEFIRACHLRDIRGPGAALLAIYKRNSKEAPANFDDEARQFIDSVVLPQWVR
jgi:hypothetical protein